MSLGDLVMIGFVNAWRIRSAGLGMVVAVVATGQAVGQPKLPLNFDVAQEGTVGERRTLAFALERSGQLHGPVPVTYVGVIVNDDAPPVITVSLPNHGSVIEGTGGTTTVPVTISISTAKHLGASLTLLRRGSARAGPRCTGGVDLIATTDTIRVKWPADNGDTWTVNLTVCGDNRDEENDTVELTAIVAVNADVAGGTSVHRLVIVDDDPPPALSVLDLTVVEGNAARVTVSLSAASDRPVDVLLTAASGTPPNGANAATAGEACAGTVDFVSLSRRISVPVGTTSATIDITTCNNVDFSTNPATFPGPGYSETLLLTASAPTNATLAKAVGVVTIRDP